MSQDIFDDRMVKTMQAALRMSSSQLAITREEAMAKSLAAEGKLVFRHYSNLAAFYDAVGIARFSIGTWEAAKKMASEQSTTEKS